MLLGLEEKLMKRKCTFNKPLLQSAFLSVFKSLLPLSALKYIFIYL